MRLAVVCFRRCVCPSAPSTTVTIEPIVGVVKTTTNKKFQRKIMWRQIRRVAGRQAGRKAEALGRGGPGRYGGWFGSCGCHQLKFMLQCEILRDRWNNTPPHV